MGVYKTIEDVKVFLNIHDANKDCTLISNVMEGAQSLLTFQCNICGKEFQRSYSALRRAKYYCCKTCASKIGHKTYDINDVKLFLKENDQLQECELLSTEYINSTKPLTFRCNLCGENFNRSFENVKHVSNYCCQSCSAKKVGKQLRKYSEDDVNRLLSEKNCVLLEPYVNITTKVKCQCPKGHIFDFVLANFLRKEEPCIICSYEKRKGENSPHWKGGGKQSTIDFIRHQLYLWKQEVLKQYEGKCDICGEKTKDLVIHHVSKNFSSILDEASQNTGIPILNCIADYSDEERDILINEVKRLHTIDIGRPMKREYHKLFHRRYGTHNNTLQQYEEFKKQIQKEKK